MAIYHMSVKIHRRSSGQSAVACEAYRSGSRLYDEELGKTYDYRKKKEVVFTQILLCANAPAEYQDREILWNSVMRVEKASNAQFAREFEMALPVEADRETQIKMLIHYYDHADDHKTVREIFQDWIQEKEVFREIKPSSLSRYKTDFKRFFPADDEFCKIEMMDITEADLEVFIKKKIFEHSLTHKTYGGLRILLMGIFKRAKRDRLTDISITSFFGDLSIPDSIFTRRSKKSDEEEVFTDAEERKLLSWLRSEPTLKKLGIILMFQTGLRVGELSALKRSDIDIARMRITVRRTETSYDGPDGHRVIDVSDEAKTSARNRIVYLPETAKWTLGQISRLNPFREWLFSYEDGRRIHGKAFCDQIHRACKAVGIPERSTHKIRKTYVSALLDGSVNEKLVQKQLGHSDIYTTKTYYRRDRMTEAEKLSEVNRIINM